MDRRAKEIWDAALGDLQLRVTRPSFETWLKGTTGLSFSEGLFVVGCPNGFIGEMLETRLYSLISEAIERIVKARVEVRFTVPQPGPMSAAADQNGADLALPSSASPAEGLEESCYRFNSRFTFENFVVGSSNALAHAAAGAVSDRPGFVYNPLFIYSGVGLGKTHLLQAIGQRVYQKGQSLIYASTEQFTNEYIRAIRTGSTDDFRDKYRSIDVLLLDDIQFIIGKEQTQEGFFHTFNSLHLNNKQIVVTCDRPAWSLSSLTDRIRSRLEGGLVVDIQPPGLETRVAILESKAERQGVEICHEILMFLAEISPRNIRELEGNLNKVIAYSQLTQTPISMALVQRALADALARASTAILSEKSILDAVASFFGTDPRSMSSGRRDKKTSLARHVAMYLLRLELNKQFSEIGRIMGGKDHTTVIHACNKIARSISSDQELRTQVSRIRELLKNNLPD